MSIEQEKAPTFQLRKICEKIQAKANQLISQISTQKPNTTYLGIESIDISKKDKQSEWSPQQYFIVQKLRNDLCRVITSSLPQVVSYQSKLNDKIQQLRLELQQSQNQVRKERQSHKDSMLEKDKLKLEMLQFEHKNKQLVQEIEVVKEKYNQTMDLCGKYMKIIRDLENDKIAQQINIKNLQKQIHQQLNQPQELQTTNNFDFQISQSKQSFTAKRQINKQINLPMQIRQKLNEADKILIRSPLAKDHILNSSHFQLSTQIVGCQKELLQIQLRQCEKDKTQLMIELEEQRVYTQKLQKEANDLQRLLDGQKKLNEKLDREVYTLVNSAKEMKIELLQEKAKCKQLEQEIQYIQQQVTHHLKENQQSLTKIAQLQTQLQNLIKLKDQLQQIKEKLSITQKKYDQLRKIKLQLQNKLQDFTDKLQLLSKKQQHQQYKNYQITQIAKNQSLNKIKQIQEMTSLIKLKYQQKLNILDKQYRQLKQKYKHLKQQNQRLYEGLDMQAKKQIKLQDKYQETKRAAQKSQQEVKVIKKEKQLFEQKLKTQTLLSKQLKREINLSEKSKLQKQRKLKRLLLTTLPNLHLQIKLIKDSSMLIKSSATVYKQMLAQLTTKYEGQIQNRLQLINDNYKSQLASVESTLLKSTQLLQSYRQQAQKTEQEKLTLMQRNANLQTKQRQLAEQLNNKLLQISSAQLKLTTLQQQNASLLKELQNHKMLQKNQLQNIQQLQFKQKEALKFYQMIDELCKQNQKLKQKLDKFILKNQQNQYLSLTNPYHANNDLSPCMIPQRLTKQKGHPKSKQYLSIKNTQSHSCLLHRPVSNNQSIQMKKSPSLEKSPSLDKRRSGEKKFCHHNKLSTSYQHTLPYHLPQQNQPIQAKPRNVFISPLNEKLQTINPILPNPGFYDQRQRMKVDFENQRNRLENVRNQYERLMVDRLKKENSENGQIQRGHYARE